MRGQRCGAVERWRAGLESLPPCRPGPRQTVWPSPEEGSPGRGVGCRKGDKFREILWHLRGILGRNRRTSLEMGLRAASSELRDRTSIAPRGLEDSDKGIKSLGRDERQLPEGERITGRADGPARVGGWHEWELFAR